MGQIVEQCCFGASVFIDGLALPPVGFMYVMVPMENVVAREAFDVAAGNVGAGSGADSELPSMPRNAFRHVNGRHLPPPP